LVYVFSFAIKQQGKAMDLWDFKKWRRKLGYTQVDAAEKLGVGRGAIQDWESEHRPVPAAVELACCELTRLWMRQPDFGPVILVYADDQIWGQPQGASDTLLLKCERYPDNEAAIRRICWLRETLISISPVIMNKEGAVIWGTPELLDECEQREEQARARRRAIPGRTGHSTGASGPKS